MMLDPSIALALALLAPHRPGDELAPGLRWCALQVELGVALELQWRGGDVVVELIPRDGVRQHRIVTASFGIAHRDGTLPEPDALAACELVAAIVRVNEAHALVQRPLHDAAAPRVRAVTGLRALVPDRSGEAYALSPYRGCGIGCRFCYAQSQTQPWRRWLQGDAVPWGSWVDARQDLPALLHDELRRLPPRPIKLCPIVSDPYQPIERRLRLTRRCVEIIRDAPTPWPTLVLTRSHAILDDLALWASLPAAWTGVSLPTHDDGVRAHFEPRAASVSQRLEILERARAAGLRTFAVVQPLLPGDVEALAEALARRTDAVAVGTLDGEEDAGGLFDTAGDAEARTPAWQRARADALREALQRRGVALWQGELPPGLRP